jgi:ribosomal protein S12 methylthiotransferase
VGFATLQELRTVTRTLHLVSLGCPKNRVDSERMAGLARRLGFSLVADPGAADVLLVNTCGFIQDAMQESIDEVLELARHKRQGDLLVMAGCLAQRHPRELARELPEVDHFIGTADLPRLQQILAGAQQPRVAVGPAGGQAEELWERLPDGPPQVAYLKIAEGCNRPCAFCIIPRLRGAQRSIGVDALAREAGALVAGGAVELALVAQDSTAYGRDLSPPARLTGLLEALDRVPGLGWIRVLYAYPSEVDRDLAEALARLPRVVEYLDLPIQHVDDRLLARMHRGYGGDRVRRTVELLRELMPGIALRTTLLTGHPGETAAAQRALLRFLEQARLDHVGVFSFSCEEGTEAAGQPDQVPAELAQERAQELMEVQRRISRQKLARLRGSELEVLVEGPSDQSEYLLQGRHPGQAPEVDGRVYLTNALHLRPGQLVRARVEDSSDHDLVASPVSPSATT